MDETIMIERDNGKVEEAEVLMFLTLTDTGNQYLIYTFNEEKDGYTTVYTSRFVKENDDILLEEVSSETEWNRIKQIMQQAVVEGRGE